MFDQVNHPAVWGVIIFALAYLAGRWWYKKDEEIEDRRREAIRAASSFREAKQDWIADLLTDYAVGDYDEVGVKLAKLVAMSKSDSELKLFLRTLALDAVTGQLKDKNVRDEMAAKLEAYGDKVGDTPEVAAKPLIKPEVAAFIAKLVEAKTAGAAAANAPAIAEDVAKAAALAGVSLSA